MIVEHAQDKTNEAGQKREWDLRKMIKISIPLTKGGLPHKHATQHLIVSRRWDWWDGHSSLWYIFGRLTRWIPKNQVSPISRYLMPTPPEDSFWLRKTNFFQKCLGHGLTSIHVLFSHNVMDDFSFPYVLAPFSCFSTTLAAYFFSATPTSVRYSTVLYVRPYQ